MRLANHVIDMVVQMASLLTALQSWEFNSNALTCKSIARKFKQTIFPTIRSPYLLWPQYDAPEVLKNLHPWGCGMFSGDIVESLSYLFEDHFLCFSTSGGGKGMQEPAFSSMHIICLDLRVGVGNAMLLYATQVHRGHA